MREMRHSAAASGLRLGAAALVLLAATPTHAQRSFGVTRWDAFVEAAFELSDQQTRIDGSNNFSFDKDRTEEKIGLSGSLFIMDPRFVSIDSTVSLGLFQDKVMVVDQDVSSSGRLLAFDVNARVVPDKPLTLLMFANRSDSTISRDFSGTTDVLNENQGATLRLQRVFFPSSLTYRQELLEEESRLGFVTGRREEIRDVLTFDGRETWKRQDLSLFYESADVDDRVMPNLSYETDTASLNHRLRFSRVTLNSSARRFERAGRLDLESTTINENVRLKHTESLSTGYQYNTSRFLVDGETTRSRTGMVSIRHQLYDSLQTDFNVMRTVNDFRTGRGEIEGGRLDLDYRNNLRSGARLLARLGGLYEVQDDDVADEQLLIFGESHTAVIGSPFRLDRTRVVPGTIVVSDTARTTIFQENLDYTLLVVGQFVEIDIIPAGLITDGQALVVDYRVLASPSMEFSTQATRFDVGIDYGWINPYYSYDRSDQRLIEGRDDRFLEDLVAHTVGVRLRWSGPRFRARLTNEFRDQESHRLDFQTLQFGQSLTYIPRADLTLTMSLKEDFSTFTIPERTTTSTVGRFNAAWRARPSLFVEGFASFRVWEDTIATDERFFDVGMRSRWRRARIEVVASIEYDIRSRDISRFTDLRTTVRVRRSF